MPPPCGDLISLALPNVGSVGSVDGGYKELVCCKAIKIIDSVMIVWFTYGVVFQEIIFISLRLFDS